MSIALSVASLKSRSEQENGHARHASRLLCSMTQESDMEITRKSMWRMISFVNDMLEKIDVKASRLVVYGKKTTMRSQEIQSAAGVLMKHANIEGIKTLDLYHASHMKDNPKKT
ncbi:unnamed protein product [Chilo suppressalis]|uniref:Uncharacterized protein n=1 Tax=Chilo suppressalis TaxID=168631 RepID=A0ABN8B110_CHISP|nr:unnamed protein product [Chilo suppressalis]